ncbi:hypothetical protein FPV67DRAFT_1465198 [Lyophyllum atratum]|nr:hypothetical protein FPV67DRAFT_1465198 [Lyophyllum atratum]
MASTSAPCPWPVEPSPPVAYLSRKALPIKRHDAQPLTREDIQFDLLHHIFSDKSTVFTNPTPWREPDAWELYVSALYNSSKCSKVLREKMVETPAFAIELAKISLLTNVGRINTTMAFFPEMKTALRTYHPVPSLQKTDGNAQDAPRIKNCLKAALLPSEMKTAPPSSPDEILERSRVGQRPPTTIVNLVFVLANHAAPLASIHFDGVLNFLDLFLPHKDLVSSDQSQDGQNPFSDDYSRKFPAKAPFLHQMTEHQINTENVDTAEEIAWGRKMSNQRNTFLQKLVNSMEEDKKAKTTIRQYVPASGNTTRRPRHPGTRAGAFMYYVPQNNQTPLNQLKRNSTPLQLQSQPHLPSRHSDLPLAPRSEPRTMLQQAWHIVNTTDPLADSDEDIENADEHIRLDYTRRVNVLSHIQRVYRPHSGS